MIVQTIVVGEHDNHSVAVLSWADGSLSHRFGGNGNGPTQLYFPQGLRLLSNGTAFIVADCYNDRLVVMTIAGEAVRVIKGGFDRPYDVVECDGGNALLVADAWQHRLVKIDVETSRVTGSYGKEGVEAGMFSNPVALALVPSTRGVGACGVVVLEQKNARVQVFNL